MAERNRRSRGLIGLRMRDFSRERISRYATTADATDSGRAEAGPPAPAWARGAQEPLEWRDAPPVAAAPMPAAFTPAGPAPVETPEEETDGRNTIPRDLIAILQAHQSLDESQPPQDTPGEPPAQRQTPARPASESRAAPASPASGDASPPRVPPRRRRGSVVDVTPVRTGLPFDYDPDAPGKEEPQHAADPAGSESASAPDAPAPQPAPAAPHEARDVTPRVTVEAAPPQPAASTGTPAATPAASPAVSQTPTVQPQESGISQAAQPSQIDSAPLDRTASSQPTMQPSGSPQTASVVQTPPVQNAPPTAAPQAQEAPVSAELSRPIPAESAVTRDASPQTPSASAVPAAPRQPTASDSPPAPPSRPVSTPSASIPAAPAETRITPGPQTPATADTAPIQRAPAEPAASPESRQNPATPDTPPSIPSVPAAPAAPATPAADPAPPTRGLWGTLRDAVQRAVQPTAAQPPADAPPKPSLPVESQREPSSDRSAAPEVPASTPAQTIQPQTQSPVNQPVRGEPALPRREPPAAPPNFTDALVDTHIDESGGAQETVAHVPPPAGRADTSPAPPSSVIPGAPPTRPVPPIKPDAKPSPTNAASVTSTPPAPQPPAAPASPRTLLDADAPQGEAPHGDTPLASLTRAPSAPSRPDEAAGSDETQIHQAAQIPPATPGITVPPAPPVAEAPRVSPSPAPAAPDSQPALSPDAADRIQRAAMPAPRAGDSPVHSDVTQPIQRPAAPQSAPPDASRADAPADRPQAAPAPDAVRPAAPDAPAAAPPAASQSPQASIPAPMLIDDEPGVATAHGAETERVSVPPVVSRDQPPTPPVQPAPPVTTPPAPPLSAVTTTAPPVAAPPSPAPARSRAGGRIEYTGQRSGPAPTAVTAPDVTAEYDADGKPDLFTALMDAGVVRPRGEQPAPRPSTVQRKPASPELSAAVPQPDSPAADLLRALGMPADTPVAGLSEVFGTREVPGSERQPGQSTVDAAIQRAAAPPAPPQGPPSITTASDPGGIQRAVEIEDLEVQTEEEEGKGSDKEGAGDVNIDELARKVYAVLRDRLRSDQERRSGL